MLCGLFSLFNSILFAAWVSPGCSDWSSAPDCSCTGSSDRPSYWYWSPVCYPASCSDTKRYRSRGLGSTGNYLPSTRSRWSSLRRGSSQYQSRRTYGARRFLFQVLRDCRLSRHRLGGCFWSQWSGWRQLCRVCRSSLRCIGVSSTVTPATPDPKARPAS